MGISITERGLPNPDSLNNRIASRLERGAILPDLRNAAALLRRSHINILGISGFSFNEVNTIDDAIMRAATGSVILSRHLPFGYRRVLNSYAFVKMGNPNPEEIDFVQEAIKDMTTLPQDSQFLSFVDVGSPSVLVLGAVDLQSQEVTRYEVDLQ